MNKKRVTWFSPDKLEKDTILKGVEEASVYAKGRLLDVGCGDKPYLEIFKNRISSYIGLDLKGGDIQRSALDLPFPKNSFDTILCTQVMEHVSDPELMIKEFHRVLKKGGFVILTMPLFWCLHEEPNDYFRFTKYSLEMILKKAKFEITYIKDRGNWSITIGQMISLYLESSFNRYGLKYPKRLAQMAVQYFFFRLSKIPGFIKSQQAPLGYTVVVRKT